MARSINQAGLDLIKQFEGCELKAYRCPANVLTIGYGSTGTHVREGMVITREQAETLLRGDLRRFEEGVSRMTTGASDNQFAALVSFAFNLGLGNLKSSTLLKLHNAADADGAANQFGRWTRAGGKVLTGLVRRRAAEAALYRKA